MDPAPRVLVERRGRVLLIGLNRPEKRNAADGAMLRALAAACTELQDDPGLRAGVLWAAGESFTAGLDLADVGPDLAAGALRYRAEDQVDPWQLSGPVRTKPLVVAVQGLCLTLGVELVLAADVAVAGRSARFAQLEVSRGILPFGGATMRFPRRCGWGDAMRWMLTGEVFDAAEALRIGLVQQVVDDGAELGTALALAARIAEQAPLAVEALLANARTAETDGEAAAAARLPGLLAGLAATEDAAEGLRSFTERRPAAFAGR